MDAEPRPASTGQATSLPQYYLCFGLLGAAGIAGIIIPATTIVTRWFVGARGAAMGVLSTGGPASAVIFYPLNAWLIVSLGWRGALVAFGCIVAAATVALALLYRDPPAAPHGRAGAAQPRHDQPASSRGEAWTLRRALRSSRLWAAFIMTALGVIGFQIMATHQVAHAVDRGFEPATVVWLFSFGGLSMVAGNVLGGAIGPFLGGWLFDVTGSYGLAFLAAAVAIAGSSVAAWLAARPVAGARGAVR